MRWAKERDSLIAQTRAFVQSVIGGRSEKASTEADQLRPIAIENTFAVAPATPAEEADAIEKSENVEPVQALPPAELPSATELPVEDSLQDEVRKEIQNRVAAFQAHQHRFAREREAYFNEVLTKARSAITRGQNNGDHDKPASLT